ncbi:MAG TPA: hypothetical protein VMZ50_05515, partial [Phycisphaerae bacterium]|nr:hypothetical protein [Phycisphaerae bacterium]
MAKKKMLRPRHNELEIRRIAGLPPGMLTVASLIVAGTILCACASRAGGQSGQSTARPAPTGPSPKGAGVARGGSPRTQPVDNSGSPGPGPTAEDQPEKVGEGATELQRLWEDLAAQDPVEGYQAALVMAGHGEKCAAFLEGRLLPAAPVSADRIQHLITDLNDDEQAVREAATQKLLLVHRAVEPALRKALAASPSSEAGARIQALLAACAADDPTAPELRRLRRALHVLQVADGEWAPRLLKKLAGGAPGAYVTEQAKAALARRTAVTGVAETGVGTQKDIRRPGPKSEFGPVIERVVYHQAHDRDTFLDLASGKLMVQGEDDTPDDHTNTMSAEANRRRHRERWARRRNADV